MPVSLYQVTVPLFIRNLKVLQQLLHKAAAHSAGKEAGLVESRLIFDMLPLTFQVQTACDTAKFYGVRVAGLANVAFPDTEKTFAELQQRVASTIAFLETVEPNSTDGKEDQEIRTVKRHGVDVPLNGTQYTVEYSLPNFFFHLSMVYAILRKQGIDVGKNDFLGNNL